MYIKTKPENVFPYHLNRLREDYPGTSFPQPYELADLTDFNVFPVTPTAKPAYDPATQGLDTSASLVGNEWVQTWAVRNATQAEIDAHARELIAADDAATKSIVKIDPTVRFLATKSPAEIEAKINADVTNIATAKVILTKLAIAVGVLARQELRD